MHVQHSYNIISLIYRMFGLFIGGVWRRLTASVGFYKPGSKKYASKMYTFNDNFTFEDGQHYMKIWFFYPQLLKRKTDTYQIKSDSNVLAIGFTPKHQANQIDVKVKNKKQASAQKGPAFAFNYSQLGSLLQMVPQSGDSCALVRSKTVSGDKMYQRLQIIDQKQQKKINFQLSQLTPSKSVAQKKMPNLVTFQLDYLSYQILLMMLKKSLFDLSGMRLLYDLKRFEQQRGLQQEVVAYQRDIRQQLDQYYREQQ